MSRPQLMSRPLLSVTTSVDVATSFLCHDLHVHYSAFNSVVTWKLCRDIMSCSSLNYGCLNWSFCCDLLVLPSIALMLRLEFCGCDLDVILHYCQGIVTSGPFFLVHLSCCDIIQPVVSFLLSHFLLLLLQYPLSLEFPTA